MRFFGFIMFCIGLNCVFKVVDVYVMLVMMGESVVVSEVMIVLVYVWFDICVDFGVVFEVV